MTIRHHVSDALLAEYVSGALEESWSLAVATHLSLCPHCRRTAAIMEASAGMLLEEADVTYEAPAEAASLAAIRERIAAKPAEAATAAASASKAGHDRLPEPLRSYLGCDLDDLKWKALGVGAFQIRIPTADKAIEARLLRIPAGKAVPEHGHGGRELTLVLRGAFRDGDLHFGPGDLEEAGDELEHQPVAEPGEDCICLAITDAPLRFHSRVMRFIQPWIGI